MSVHEFVFSEKTTIRVRRHLLFWAVFALHVFFFRFYVYNLKFLGQASIYLTRLEDLLFVLPVSLFIAYFSIYFLLPRYLLKGKYVQLLGIVLLLAVMLVFISYLASIWFNVKLAWDLPASRADIVRQIDFTFNNGIVYPLAVSAFAIGIKMAKNFYVQQKQNTVLAIQKINAGVQMLKSQVHARFLFHSLKSIHEDLIAGTGKSPEMLLRLSELLSYILYESDKMMPLEKELSLLDNYIGLEKISWGDQLVITSSSHVDAKGQLIEPLLLLPLAEYVFDSIDRHRLQQIFLQLATHTDNLLFYFNINVRGICAKEPDYFNTSPHLLQVRKRLETQYAGKHRLNISNLEDGISISLVLETGNSSAINTINQL
ncbi:MAG: histidine kinase [Bacteroidota bacterium]